MCKHLLTATKYVLAFVGGLLFAVVTPRLISEFVLLAEREPLFVNDIAEREQQLRVMCEQYRIWTQRANDRVQTMEDICGNLS